jgi:RNA polymerase sigma-70 factor (ECF subfamily)
MMALLLDPKIAPPATLAAVFSSERSGERLSDPELVARCQRGEVEAFEVLYRQHSRSLYNLAYRMAGNPSDAEDLLQEIFLLAFSKLSGFRGESSLRTWLYRLAVNRCLDHIRSRSARQREQSVPLDEGHAAASDAGAIRVRLDLERAIGALPESYRAAFLLYDVEGFEHREVGQILGVAEGTSKSLVHKARHQIRQFLSNATTAKQV